MNTHTENLTGVISSSSAADALILSFCFYKGGREKQTNKPWDDSSDEMRYSGNTIQLVNRDYIVKAIELGRGFFPTQFPHPPRKKKKKRCVFLRAREENVHTLRWGWAVRYYLDPCDWRHNGEISISKRFLSFAQAQYKRSRVPQHVVKKVRQSQSSLKVVKCLHMEV